jgi:hypothetical protein
VYFAISYRFHIEANNLKTLIMLGKKGIPTARTSKSPKAHIG